MDTIKLLKEYRDKHGLRNYELARVLNTTEANISRWFNDRHKPSKAWRIIIEEKLK